MKNDILKVINSQPNKSVLYHLAHMALLVKLDETKTFEETCDQACKDYLSTINVV